MIKLTKKILWYILLSGSAVANSTNNEWTQLMNSLAYKLDSYALSHDGRLPKEWQDLNDPVYFQKIEMTIGGTISSKVVYFGESNPIINLRLDGDLIAMTSFLVLNHSMGPKTEQLIGRYIIIRGKNLRFGLSWESEQNIQAALNKTGRFSSPAGRIYEEVELDPFPGTALMEEALKHGIAFDVAAPIIEAHIKAVQAGRAIRATTWAEIANPPIPPTPTNTGSQSAGARSAPAAFLADFALPLKWLAGAAAALVALGLGWRAFRRK
jgi:hypothetical protein